jgi:hypothetical protein
MTPPQVVTRPKLPVPLAVALCVLAWTIFAFGLIAPLTPSEGHPSTLSLAVFVGLPIALLGATTGNSRDRWLKISGVVQMVLLVIVASYVVALTWRE